VPAAAAQSVPPPGSPFAVPRSKPPYQILIRAADQGSAAPAAPAERTTANEGERETTVNGLVRRVPRAERQSGTAHETGSDRAAERVRSMIEDFRAGMRQTEQNGPRQEER